MRKRLAVLAPLLLGSGAAAAGTDASSHHTDGTSRHGPALAFDGRLDTGWAEGQADSGEGAWIELQLDSPTDVISVSVWPGNLSEGKRSLKEFGRPRTLTVTLGGMAGEDVTKTVVAEDGAEVGVGRIDVPVRGRARTVRVRIDEAYPGIVHDHTFISEIAINFVEGEPHPWVRKVYSWVEGSEGERPKEKNRAEVVALYEKARGSDEDAARDAFRELMQRASNGAPFVRDWTTRYVPKGFWVHAIPPDPVAVDALLKIKDPNAIPALEQASVRVTGHDERRLHEQVDMFYAFQELLGGPRANVPNWGQRGWAPGELQSFGEPLPIDIDQQGRVLAADIGNNRVQRFTDTGRVDRAWGGDEPDITDTWMGATRTWYVSGARPGTEEGAFVNPLDVEVIPGKFEDGFAVLDATGRVQVFDAEGENQATFTAPVHNIPLVPGVGGQAYLLYSKGELVVIWSGSAWVYTLDGQEVNRWDLTDGVPSGATVLKNGKLGLIFQDRLVMYSTDGFRHGSLLGEELGQGFEAWDVTLDEEDRLWAVTDTGWALKYKRPGKLDFKVRLEDTSLRLPRIAVRGNVIYLSEGDRIEVIDALELQRKAELAEAGPS